MSTDDYYNEATKNALINNNNIKDKTKTALLILSLSLVGVVSFLGYNFLQDNSVQKTNVMGVSHTKSDIDYASEIEKLDTPDMDGEYSSQLVEYVNKELNPVSQDKTYTRKERWREIVIVVKQGDTLASLAKKYYNDSSAYDKIIDNNPEIINKSNFIYPGQKLRITQPY